MVLWKAEKHTKIKREKYLALEHRDLKHCLETDPHETPAFINRCRDRHSSWAKQREILQALQILFNLSGLQCINSLMLFLQTPFHLHLFVSRNGLWVFHINQNVTPTPNSCTANPFCFPSTILNLQLKWLQMKGWILQPQLASAAVPPALHEVQQS